MKTVLVYQDDILNTSPQGKSVDEQVDAALDRLLVEFGKEILSIVPGKVSTEVDARFSFDTQTSVEKARHIIEVNYSVCLTSFTSSCVTALQICWYRQITDLD